MATKSTASAKDNQEKVAAYQAVAEMDKATAEKKPAPSTEPDPDPSAGPVSDSQVNEEDGPSVEERLQAAEAEAKEHYDRLLRISAEFENYKKRVARELQDARRFANESLLRELLPVVDNLERALVSGPDGEKAAASILQGVELTLKEINKLFDKFVVAPIEAEGKPFDPAFHQAMMQEPSAAVAENTVLRELLKGYTLHGRLLRPSMVVVAQKMPSEADDQQPSAEPTD